MAKSAMRLSSLAIRRGKAGRAPVEGGGRSQRHNGRFITRKSARRRSRLSIANWVVGYIDKIVLICVRVGPER